MTATVAVIGTLNFPPERIEELLPHVKAVVEATNRLDGCISYEMSLDPFRPGVVRLMELWPDHDSLARHLQQPHMTPWREATQRCGMLGRQLAIYDVKLVREL